MCDTLARCLTRPLWHPNPLVALLLHVFMKHLIGSSLFVLLLWGCQHKADPTPTPLPAPPTQPAPTLLGEPWTLQSEELEITPLDSSAADVRILPPRTGPLTVEFVDEEHFTLDVQLPSGGSRHHLESTYDYEGHELSFARMYSRAAGAIISRNMRVTELNAHKLVLVEAWQSPTTHYFTIQTFSR